jgi:phage gp29-like protein
MPQLFDQFNRPIAPLKRPETREIASVSIRDRWSSYPSAGLTPARLAAIFRQADFGDLRAQAELFEEMEEKDAHLSSVLQTRRLSVLGLETQVEEASESTEDKKIAEFCREALEDLELEDLFTHLLGAVGAGYAAAESIWENGAKALIRGFNLIHPKNISFVNSLAPLVITDDNYQGVEPKPFQLVYHRAAAKSGHDTRNGVLRVCAYMYLFKNYSLKDWVVFNEIFGMPLRLGKYDPSATPADREALRAAISSLGSDAAGIISKSTEIEFVEASSRLSGTTNPYQVMIEMCNREISKAVLGQTLTSDSAPGSGTLAGNAHENVRQDLLEADAEMLAETIREQIIRPLVGFNFGWDKPVPKFALPIQDSPDLKLDSEVCKNLDGIGVPIPLSHIYEHFGIPEPKGDEPTTASIKAPAQPQQPPGPSGPDDANPGGRPAEEPPVAAGEKGKRGKGEKGNGRAAAMKDHRLEACATLPLREGELELISQDAQVIKTQQELEALSQAALMASADAAALMLAPVRGLIEAGKSLEDIRAGLVDAYGVMPVDEMGELLYQARMLAWMKGRLDA